jgi:hypothetical protein
LTINTKAALPSDCNYRCIGNLDENCGGEYSLNLYYSGAPVPPLPTIVQLVDVWNWVGCYRYASTHCFFVRQRTCDFHKLGNSDLDSNSNGRRTLSAQMAGNYSQYDNTVENCIHACATSGYTMAGVEFAGECCTTVFPFVPLMTFPLLAPD